jgi:hypothetical protein
MRSMWLSRSLLPRKRLIFHDCGLHSYACPEGAPPLFPPSHYNCFVGLGVSLLAFGTQVLVFKPGRSRRIFKGEKILSMPSFGGEVKPSVPCRRFAVCKRCLELRGSWILGEICRNITHPQTVHLPLLEVSRVIGREGI